VCTNEFASLVGSSARARGQHNKNALAATAALAKKSLKAMSRRIADPVSFVSASALSTPHWCKRGANA